MTSGEDTKDCLKHGATPQPPVSEDERDPMCTCEGTKATFSDAEQLAKIRKVIEIALSTESLKRSVVMREIADILGLPHEGPDPEARAFVERLKARLEKARE